MNMLQDSRFESDPKIIMSLSYPNKCIILDARAVLCIGNVLHFSREHNIEVYIYSGSVHFESLFVSTMSLLCTLYKINKYKTRFGVQT